jgi:hypothetical protein
VAKRSPILGYNHNVKYRGIVFHVQTEDSGLLSPHLFTHLFHEGVIVSTRKLVYDPGANEEAIKALMQAQHKAVMKDLRRGTFDEKIDQYLGSVPGLEPTTAGSTPAAAGRGERAPTEATPPPPEALAPATADTTVPAVAIAATVELELELPDDVAAEAIPLETLPPGEESVPIELTLPAKSRTQTARKSGAAEKLPPLPMEDAPTVSDPAGSIAAAVAAANATTASSTMKSVPPVPRGSTPPPTISHAAPTPAPDGVIELELDDESTRARLPRDTAVESVTIAPRSRTTGDAVPRRSDTESSQGQRRTPTGERPASHGAAALPPMKPPSRPSMTPPTVMSRSLNDGRVHKPGDDSSSEAVEVYAPAPPSAEPPPGSREVRSGTYSMGRARPPSDNVPLREKTGRIAAINPSMIPQRDRATPPPRNEPPPAPTRPPTGPSPVRESSQMKSERPSQPMRPLAKPETPPAGAPQRVNPVVTAPMRATPQSGNVVMTRPAVIVGAPAKPAGAPPPTPPRVRKAREEEGRGFGSGLISEKSLDEVILAYLSEDAEDK